MKKIIEFDEKCKECDGTGLYKGMGEGKGFAVVCHNCKGTGKFHFKHIYEEFTRRKKRNDIERVIQVNPGVCVGGVYDEIHQFKAEDFGGMPYEDWMRGKPFPPKSELRKFIYPAWWYQSANYDLKPNWKECGYGSFSSCKHFPDKKKCWKRFDKEIRCPTKKKL